MSFANLPRNSKGDGLEFTVLKVLFAMIPLTIFLIISAVFMDVFYFNYKAFDAVTACEVKRMEARRKFLSTHVVCVPAYRGTRNDTLSINLNQ
jgi:hypothetical protein